MDVLVFAGTGFLGPSADDAIRLAILVVGVLTIVGIAAGLLALRHYARLLVDVEQMARESRNRLRDQLESDATGLARELAAIAGDVAELRQTIERGSDELRA
jgi:hypothetical protein